MNINQNFIHFIKELSNFIQPSDISLSDSANEVAIKNSLGIETSISGVVNPRCLEDLQIIVKLAAKHSITLYPVSKGKNIGYGDKTPYQEQQLIVNLSNLNRIREFDSVHGEVVVEPGVTQHQLAEFLKLKKANFWADVTGASPEASILGNCLEAGFGHTPIGDHRKHILEMEMIFADGKIFSTGEMPCAGPDLAQLFVQSNFAVITAVRIPLFPIPEKCITYTLSFENDEQFCNGIVALKELRQIGVINSLVHSGNSTRTLMTSSQFPENLDSNLALSEIQCQELLAKSSVIRFGAWTSVGAIYGFKNEVNEKVAKLKKAMRKIAKVRIFNDKKISQTEWLLNQSPLKNIIGLNVARNSFKALKALHGILRGQPSNVPSENIFWRVKNKEDLGLSWLSPVIPATAEDIAKLLALARPVYAKYNFEMPVTLTLINTKKLTAVFNFSFDRSSKQDCQRALAAYKELSQITNENGYKLYRLGIQSDCQSAIGIEKIKLLNILKKALDPFNIIAPGRYGISVQSINDNLKEIEYQIENSKDF